MRKHGCSLHRGYRNIPKATLSTSVLVSYFCLFVFADLSHDRALRLTLSNIAELVLFDEEM